MDGPTASAARTETLCGVGLDIVRLFREVITTDRMIEDDGNQRLEAEYDRFELWAVNIGLFVPGHGALEYRVREAASLKNTLLRFMTDLKDSLTLVHAYCNNFVGIASATLETQDAFGHDALPAPDATSQDSGSPVFSLIGETDSDVDLLLDAVKDPLNRLYRLSTKIRDPSTRFASSKAQAVRKINPETGTDFMRVVEYFDHDYVSSLFLQYAKTRALEQASPVSALQSVPREDLMAQDAVWEPIRSLLIQNGDDVSKQEESFLVYRLAKANTSRRKHFAYWERHREKLALHTEIFTQDIQPPRGLGADHLASEPLAMDSGLPLHTAPAPLSVTTATCLPAAQFAIHDDMSTVSISEYSSTTELSHDAGTFPPPPTQKDGEKYFECPYCFTLCSTKSLRPRSWKAHIIRDLRPYICTYQQCRNPDQLYDTRQDWMQHENSCHRTVWRCPSHPDLSFSLLGAFLAHLDDGHVDGGGKPVSNSLIRACESLSERSDRPCPICCFATEKTGDMSRHIAVHLERIALFSLPRSVGEDDDEQDEKGSQSVNLPDDDSRDDFQDSPVDDYSLAEEFVDVSRIDAEIDDEELTPRTGTPEPDRYDGMDDWTCSECGHDNNPGDAENCGQCGHEKCDDCKTVEFLAEAATRAATSGKEAKDEKPAETEVERLERMIQEMEEADAKREKEQDEKLERMKKEAEDRKKKAAEKEVEAKDEKPAETEDEELERMIQEMEEADAKREKEQAEKLERMKKEAEERKEKEAEKESVANSDKKLREQEPEMERLEEQREKERRVGSKHG